MKPIDFPEAHIVIAKNQPEYIPLPAYVYEDDTRETVFCWKLTFIERFKLLFTGKLWQSSLRFSSRLQAQRLSVDKPDMPMDDIKAAERVLSKS